MNIINPKISIKFHTITLAANELKQFPVVGARQFILLENSSATDVEVAIGNSREFNLWPKLFSYVTPHEEDIFDVVNFRNPTAAIMTITFVVSNSIIENKTAWIMNSVVIDDTSNGISTPGAITVLPAGSTVIVIDAGPAIDVGGGVVGIPVTAHPFFPGNVIAITDCPQYNGTYTVLATTTANQVDITAVFMGGLLDNAAAVDLGGGVVGIPITGHPYIAGETITIAGTVNYDGDYVVVAGGGANQVNITSAYNAENFAGAETHTLTFDGVDDSIALSTPNMIAADGTRKELHITNNDAANAVYWGDNTVDADTFRGVIIQANSVYIITTTDAVYFSVPAALAAGVIVSWNNLTKV